ncbi:MAG: tRNA uridine-5-carboxymethylaminomethyl(34) synthesis GTPase MnmE [Victivallaceae bacterium]|nr:tRNA uridine-5-carboxymethylaminomethyl(34) synthesis GTPase MnmE [Victivallaceae bacterium]
MNPFDTIAAIASGGTSLSAITIVRISGSRAIEIGNRVWKGKRVLSREHARVMQLGYAANGDRALAVCMPGPHSYTGEDVVELHCHGGFVVAESALSALCNAGCRPAEPGEFTYRAFVNGKIDLTQAEAVNAVISSGGARSLALAQKQLDGALGDQVRRMRQTLLALLAECESHLDFPDEELTWEDTVTEQLETMILALRKLADSAAFTQMAQEGISLVLAGRPNAGKSSLLNALLGRNRAIVSNIPGTTRDTLEEHLELGGIPVRVIDTAGLRESDNELERLGVERSRKALKEAQVIFWVLDGATEDRQGELEFLSRHLPDPRIIALWNKIDLAATGSFPSVGDVPVLEISATTGKNIDRLPDVFLRTCRAMSPGWDEPESAVSQRHAAAAAKACALLTESLEQTRQESWELAAIPIRGAWEALGEITGENIAPDVLEHIFRNFCIGK